MNVFDLAKVAQEYRDAERACDEYFDTATEEHAAVFRMERKQAKLDRCIDQVLKPDSYSIPIKGTVGDGGVVIWRNELEE